MRAGADYVILKTTTLFRDTVEVGGKELYIDTNWEPHEHKKTFAEVVAVPEYLTDEYSVFQDSSGQIFYQDSFPIDIKVGDIAYADWSTINEHNEIGKYLYRVPYCHLYAVERKKEALPSQICDIGMNFIGDLEEAAGLERSDLVFTPLFSWVFLEPYFGEDLVEENGVRFRESASGLATTTQVEELKTVARVKYIGRNIAGKEPAYKPGDLVCCNLEWAATMRIHEREYYAIRQQDIMGLYEAV